MVRKIYQVRIIYVPGKKKLSNRKGNGFMSEEKKTKKNHEPLCEDLAGKDCGLKKVIDIIGGKWKIMILCVIEKEGTVRYGDLNRRVFGITNTMLATSLKEMERDGLVERKQYMEMPVRVEYSLTKKGESIVPILLQLKKWGEENLISTNKTDKDKV